TAPPLTRILIVQKSSACNSKSFSIDYNENCFRKDGQCFRYISGSIHYFRIPSYYWRDRLLKMYMTGLNAVQVYIPWNFHEPVPGMYDFNGDRDLSHFLDLTNELGLLVIIRPGPYICAEWDMGGLPAWLLNNKDIALRTSDPDYLAAVDSWLSVLLPKLRPRLYSNGGNIISVQVENEYGSFMACDYSYLRHLLHLYRLYLGDEIVLFTTDGNTEKELQCGSLQDLHTTVDFGPGDNATKAFNLLRKYQPKGPLVNSEYYTGWLDYWGEKHSTTSKELVSRGLKNILEMGARADFKKTYKPIPTSYDYDAPLSEAGDPTDKLNDIRNVISQFQPVPQGPVPPPTRKMDYGFVSMNKVGSLLDFLDVFSPEFPTETRYPLTFEEVKQYFGFVLYRTRLPRDVPIPTFLSSVPSGVHDRAYVSVGGVFNGVLERDHVLKILVAGKAGDWLDVLVENMGRINFGSCVNDLKGLVSNVTLGGDILTDWLLYPLNLEGPISEGWPHVGNNFIGFSETESNTGPSFYSGTFQITTQGDTFLSLPQWTKGQAWINGFNVGRYWPARGPQITLYVPGNILRLGENTVTLLELERASELSVVHFIDRPILG
uniref:Galactosidase beta 1 n=1 Tax=Xenopus tropicalis TaxID=8364 RepID=F7A9H0_XENTR